MHYNVINNYNTVNFYIADSNKTNSNFYGRQHTVAT